MATIAECKAEIAAIDAKLDEIRGLPTSGRVGKTAISHASTFKELRAERARWLACLRDALRRAGRLGARRREVF